MLKSPSTEARKRFQRRLKDDRSVPQSDLVCSPTGTACRRKPPITGQRDTNREANMKAYDLTIPRGKEKRNGPRAGQVGTNRATNTPRKIDGKTSAQSDLEKGALCFVAELVHGRVQLRNNEMEVKRVGQRQKKHKNKRKTRQRQRTDGQAKGQRLAAGTTPRHTGKHTENRQSRNDIYRGNREGIRQSIRSYAVLDGLYEILTVLDGANVVVRLHALNRD